MGGFAADGPTLEDRLKVLEDRLAAAPVVAAGGDRAIERAVFTRAQVSF